MCDQDQPDTNPYQKFREHLTTLINTESIDNEVNMADHVLANFIVGVIQNLSYAHYQQYYLDRGEPDSVHDNKMADQEEDHQADQARALRSHPRF